LKNVLPAGSLKRLARIIIQMSVEIRFEPSGLSGLVAEGAYISDAARRMGAHFPVQCNQKGECTTCLITILTGWDLVSSPSEVEQRILGVEQLAKQYRLACQTILERAGEVAVHVHPEAEKSEEATNDPASMRKKFGELPLSQKISTLVQLEALTMNEALNALIDKPLAAGEKLFDKVFKPRTKQ
jgi:ferredoxin